MSSQFCFCFVVYGFMGTPVPGIPGAFYVDGDDDAVFYTDEYFDDEYDDDYY